MNKDEFCNVKVGDVLYTHQANYGEPHLCEASVEYVIKDNYGFHKIIARDKYSRVQELEFVRYVKDNWFTDKLSALRRGLHVAEGLYSFFAEELKSKNDNKVKRNENLESKKKYKYCISEISKQLESTN